MEAERRLDKRNVEIFLLSFLFSVIVIIAGNECFNTPIRINFYFGANMQRKHKSFVDKAVRDANTKPQKISLKCLMFRLSSIRLFMLFLFRLSGYMKTHRM